MKTITIHRATQNSGYDAWQRPMTITLPDVPGVDITHDRNETAPRSAPIRGETNWKRDKLLAMAARVRT